MPAAVAARPPADAGSRPVRVLLVDDHNMFREAIHHLLSDEPGIQVVGELSSGDGLDRAITELAPDVVVMDVSLPGANGIESTRELLARHPGQRVLALSAFNYRQFVSEMLEAGATGYVIKSAHGMQLVQAIQLVAQGKTYLCPEAASILVEASRRGTAPVRPGAQNKRLGRRETQVLRLLAEGMSSPQIGQTLHIAPSTVDVHRRNIMDKLELRSVAELTKYAVRTGLTAI
ncbi:MAG: response regulator transcription factor [Rhodoferax sp.]|nr:response regulator transcription factor [Rhodoferax sp.]